MFENLSERLDKAIKNITNTGKISEENIDKALKEVRLALLEADVNYKVVKEFTSKVKEKALGEEIRKSLKPREVFIKIVNDELVSLLGEANSPLTINKNFTKLMVVGLNGAGKTTAIGKLANLIRKKHKKNPLLVACDVYRPAAIKQLETLGKSLDIKVYKEDSLDPVMIAKNGIEYALQNGHDYVLIDTAGRLHVDEELMNEMKQLEEAVKPDETLLVIDSMVGQDSINVINGFNEAVKLTGAIITKLDSDTRGGVALSIKYLTNIPIKFIGVSEKMDGIDAFYPERIANRILGMGDIVSLVEKVESELDQEEALRASKKMKAGNFDLDDFLKQLKQIRKLGPLENLIKLIPGASKMGLGNVNIDPKQLSHIEAIILSMTTKERKNPDILKASQKIRISKGSGRTVEEVNRLLKQFEEMKKMMKMMKNGNMKFPF